MQFFNLTQTGLLRIKGDSAKKLLQGQLTCNLDELQPGQLQLAAHCNPQGRVISLFHLFLLDDYFLQMPRSLIPLASNALKKYAVFFKVTIDDVSDEFVQVGCINPELPEIKNDFTLLRCNESSTQFLYFGKSLPTTEFADENVWHHTAIQAKVPTIYPDTSEKFLPHELDLPKLNAVSFNKGCYTGQEIIARMHYRGKLKKHLAYATVTTTQPIERNLDIYAAGNIVGTLIDYCELQKNNYALLILIDETATEALSLDPSGTNTFLTIE